MDPPPRHRRARAPRGPRHPPRLREARHQAPEGHARDLHRGRGSSRRVALVRLDVPARSRAHTSTPPRRPRPARERRVTGWKLVRRVGLVVLLAALLYYVVTFVQVWWAARQDDTRRSQAIVVLGAAQYNGRPSPVFKARLDHAATLYHDRVAPLIVVTGGKQTGDMFTEATSGANYLHDKGIPDDAILRETTSHTSCESLSAAARVIRHRNDTQVVLVSVPSTALRNSPIAQYPGLATLNYHATTR